MTTDPKIKQVLSNSPDWKSAVCDLIDYKTEQGQPFSSGEVVRDIRINRPDLRFGARGAGDFIRDLYWNQSINYRDGNGNQFFAHQVPRTATGKTRTPVGQPVFVYAPSMPSGQAHDFEVEIPQPGQTTAPTQQQSNDNSGVFTPPQAAVVKASTPHFELYATVQGDRRMRIPRSAFEAFSHKANQSIRPGDDVFIVMKGDNITVTLDDGQEQEKESKRFSLTHDKGAIKFASFNKNDRFDPGVHYDIQVHDGNLIIDLSNPQ